MESKSAFPTPVQQQAMAGWSLDKWLACCGHGTNPNGMLFMLSYESGDGIDCCLQFLRDYFGEQCLAADESDIARHEQWLYGKQDTSPFAKAKLVLFVKPLTITDQIVKVLTSKIPSTGQPANFVAVVHGTLGLLSTTSRQCLILPPLDYGLVKSLQVTLLTKVGGETNHQSVHDYQDSHWLSCGPSLEQLLRISNGQLCPVCQQIGKLRCSTCQEVFYCSREHQRAHWPTHKQPCKQQAEERKDPPVTLSAELLSGGLPLTNGMVVIDLPETKQLTKIVPLVQSIIAGEHPFLIYTSLFDNDEHPLAAIPAAQEQMLTAAKDYGLLALIYYQKQLGITPMQAMERELVDKLTVALGHVVDITKDNWADLTIDTDRCCELMMVSESSLRQCYQLTKSVAWLGQNLAGWREAMTKVLTIAQTSGASTG